ncbi:MAG: glutamine--fructose-6-phosphate transaminase (isomerizing) [Bdellovibrionales bacterium]|nr:glutamine--fructose-6-phosphate transaminase (isomerizing) [Bdellovibrionales bacterium]
MCGIVGYLGPENPKDVIIHGLSQLEYRGYDSAGVAILHDGHLKRIRAKGKLSELAAKLEHEPFNGHLGIGHTRWATHGIPSEGNAHPHMVDGICIVHNGIIENFVEIKEELIKAGSKIQSDTDSELVAHLIARETKKGADLEAAVLRVIPQLRGAYAIVVASEAEPQSFVAFKNGPPLIFGFNQNEKIVASDVQAVVQRVRECLYLEDGEVLSVKNGKHRLLKANGEEVVRGVTRIDWTPERAEKRGFSHFMLKEIFEQPSALAAALEPLLDLETQQITLDKIVFREGMGPETLANADRIVIVACGTSFYSGLVGEYLFEKFARVPVEVELASEFRYRNPILGEKTVAIFITQSGETADTLATMRQVKEMGRPTISICNVKNSTIDREADVHLYMRSGVEISVASTKALSCTLTVLNALAIWLGVQKGVLSKEESKSYVRGLIDLPSHVEKVLNYASYFEEFGDHFKSFKGFLYLGRGANYPIALEGALKMKEIAYIHAEGYAAGEMKHGPIALIDSQMAVVVVAPADDLYEKTVSNLEEVRARGAQVISFGTGENARLKSVSKHYLSLPAVTWNLNPILSVVPLQLLAFHVAKALGHDVDQPRNLAKSVTVE